MAVVRLIDRLPDLGEDDLSERQRRMWDRVMSTSDVTVYVAEVDGEVVGTTALLVMPHITYDCHPTAFLESMVVRAEYRRRGIARMMVERLLADARAQACRKVQLLTHKRHAADAHAFYRSLGFEAEAEGFRLYIAE